MPSKSMNVTKLLCHKNSKVDVFAAMNKRTILAVFVVAEMEIWKALISLHTQLCETYRTSFCAETLHQQLDLGPRYNPKCSLSSMGPGRKDPKVKLH